MGKSACRTNIRPVARPAGSGSLVRPRAALPLPTLALDADHGLERGNLARKAREMRRLDHSPAVLVGPGRFFGDAAHRRALDDNAARTQLVDHLSAMPLLQRLMPAQTPPGAMAGRGECSLGPYRRSDHNRRRGAHAAADEHGLPSGSEGIRQVRMVRAESAGGTLAMDEEAPARASDLVLFLLAGIVGHVEKRGK